jgi:Arc/MetJ-type ribon-helix-helix transcriptional regulator
MPKLKIAITVDDAVVGGIDMLVTSGRFANRSQAFEAAAAAELDRSNRTRLAQACRDLDPAEERAMAEEGMSDDISAWPKY